MLELLIKTLIGCYGTFSYRCVAATHDSSLSSCFNCTGSIGSFLEERNGLVVSAGFAKESQHPETEMPRHISVWVMMTTVPGRGYRRMGTMMMMSVVRLIAVVLVLVLLDKGEESSRCVRTGCP